MIFQKAKVLFISHCPSTIYAQTHSVVWPKTSNKSSKQNQKASLQSQKDHQCSKPLVWVWDAPQTSHGHRVLKTFSFKLLYWLTTTELCQARAASGFSFVHGYAQRVCRWSSASLWGVLGKQRQLSAPGMLRRGLPVGESRMRVRKGDWKSGG